MNLPSALVLLAVVGIVVLGLVLVLRFLERSQRDTLTIWRQLADDNRASGQEQQEALRQTITLLSEAVAGAVQSVTAPPPPPHADGDPRYGERVAAGFEIPDATHPDEADMVDPTDWDPLYAEHAVAAVGTDTGVPGLVLGPRPTTRVTPQEPDDYRGMVTRERV